MKKMRFVMCVAALAMLFSGCKIIYESQIGGKWKVDTYLKNGSDDTESFLLLFNDYVITFYTTDGNKDFVEEYNAGGIVPITNNGTWVIDKKPDGRIGEFQLRLTDDSGVRIYDIIKMSRKEMQLYRDLGDGDYEEFYFERPPEA